MATQLNDITIIVNNQQVAYEADSLSWKDGFGDYSIRNAVAGAGQTEQVFSMDLSTQFGMVKFSIPSTPENESFKRAWKTNRNNNVVELIGPPGSRFAKIFTQAAIIADPETNASTDGSIDIEFNSNPAQ